MYRRLAYAVLVDSNPVGIIDVEFTDAYKTPVTKCSFTTNADASGWLGKSASISIGLGTPVLIFTGTIVEVNYTRLPGVSSVVVANILDRAQKHYIVTSSLEEPWTRNNIKAEDLVRDLLAEAGITSYVGWNSSFTFGVSSPVEFNLVASLDAINQINNILATNIYALGNTVYWNQIQPVPGTPTKSYSRFVSVNYTFGTKDLRNKVVLFGKPPIYAEASAESPHLPPGFYQTAIVSSELVGEQSMADQAVVYNLDLYNKLTEELRVEVEGDPTVNVRDTVTISNTGIGADGDWFVYSVKHAFADTFVTTLFLRR